MSPLYNDHHRKLQDLFDSRRLADTLEANIVRPTFDDTSKAFIESRDFFFLSTLASDGNPTVSYKGGSPGFIQVADEETLVFPSYNGNGMFYSMGNIESYKQVGLLFIDFETPNRLRVHGEATLRSLSEVGVTTSAVNESVKGPGGPEAADFPGAELLIEVKGSSLWVNCARYIHPHKKLSESRYVPKAGVDAPIPAWKTLEGLSSVLPEPDQQRLEGKESLTYEDYARLLQEGKS